MAEIVRCLNRRKGKGAVSSSLLSRGPSADVLMDAPDRTQGVSGDLLVLYGRLLGVLLGGYLLLDKAFAYIHLPGTPLYAGEMVLTVGGLGVLAATGYLRIPVRDEPILALLAAFFLWAFIRFLPGFRTYGIMAVRDFALCYYCLFAFFTVAALARAPDLLDRWLAQLSRFVPWLLLWLPLAMILPYKVNGPSVPFSGGVSILTHRAGSGSIAAIIVLGFMWLFPGTRGARSRALWSIMALLVIALSATQNRGGLLGATAGAVVGLAFLPSRDRLRLIIRAVAVTTLGLALALQLSLKLPTTPDQTRAFSASQLIANVLSIGGAKSGSGPAPGGNNGRDQLWTLVFHRQVADGKLLYGFGFGLNLPYLVNDTQVTSGEGSPLRSPHNSHDDVLARLGLIGISLWIAMWLGWYWRLVTGCWRLARRGMHARRQVGVLCLMVATAILVSSFFDAQLEGAQIAALLWTAFGVGVAVTSFRGWFRPANNGLGDSGVPVTGSR
jgi:O-Antigen ligase